MPTYEFIDHHRFQLVVSLLAEFSIGAPAVFGHVAFLERFMVKWRADGNLSGLSDPEIEAAAQWFPPNIPNAARGRLAAALKQSGLIYSDEAGVVRFRGWQAHAPEYVRKRLRRSGLEFIDSDGDPSADGGGQNPPVADNGGQRRTMAANGRPEQSRAEQSRAEQSSAGAEIHTPPPLSAPAAPAGIPSANLKTPREAKPVNNPSPVKEPDAGPGAKNADFVGDSAGAAGAGAEKPIDEGDLRAVQKLFTNGVTRESWRRMKPDMQVTHALHVMGEQKPGKPIDPSFRTAVARRVRSKPAVAGLILAAFREWAAHPPGTIDNPGGWVRDRLKRAGVHL